MTTFTTKQKGTIGQLAVAADLTKRGYQVAFPYGDFGDFDLLLCRNEPYRKRIFDRVQVKYTESDGEVIKVRSRCHSVTAGQVSATRLYDQTMIDWIAVYDKTTDVCYYVESYHLGGGKSELYLRLSEPKKSHPDIRWAKDYLTV